MKQRLESLLKGRELLLLGFGKEGRSTYAFIRQEFPALPVAIADRDPGIAASLPGLDRDPQLSFYLGEDYLDALHHHRLIIKSPGVAIPDDFPLLPGSVLTSQTHLMLEAYHSQIIGVTGTKGKSTTSSLIRHILKASGFDSVLVGNIGRPPFDYLSQIGPGTRIVFEMSSHQLENSILAPQIAVLLNLFPEHLDRYESLGDYYGVKMRIMTGQKENDTFIYNEDIPEITRRVREAGLVRNLLSYSAVTPVQRGARLSGKQIWLVDDSKESFFTEIAESFPLRGRHNLMNAMAAILAARAAGAAPGDIHTALYTFEPLEHRLEFAGVHQGILFYNDSIATIPEATIEAVRALPLTDTLILGGYDRMLDYHQLAVEMAASGVRNFIFLGKAGQRMLELFRKFNTKGKKFIEVKDLEEAFTIIPIVTETGKICLLSPAAASYDIFRNFEERGRKFKELAERL